KVDNRSDTAGDGYDDAWKVDLGNQPLVADEATAALAQDAREELPRQESSVGERRIGQAASDTIFEADELAEEDREDEHHGERLEDSPDDTDGGLFVADLDVPPRQEPDKLTVVGELAQVEEAKAACRLDNCSYGRRRGSAHRSLIADIWAGY